MSSRADTLRFTNGSIVTMDPDEPVVGEVIVKGNRIAWAGRQGSSPPEFRKAKQIDLKGRLLLSAFSDAHTHFLYYARSLNDVDLHGVNSLREAISRIRSHVRASKGSSGWITGRGLDVNHWKSGWPNRQDLDRIIPNRPAAFFTHDEHSLWVNSQALAAAGIDRETPDPPGGRIARNQHGEPTGILLETAYRLVWEKIPTPKPSDDERLIRQTQSRAHEVGVAAIGDMGEPATFRAFAALASKDQLRLRLWKSIPLAEMDRAIKLGLRTGLGDEWVKFGGVKMFLDGALGSQTAWMYRPFKSDRSNRGICRLARKDFEGAVRCATAHGLSVCAHAIGDAAVGQAIDVFNKYQTRFPKGHPPRIEHVQLLDPNDLPKLARSNIIASMQPSHLLTDRDIADKHWGLRTKNAFVCRALWDRGVIMAFGSDVPIEPIRPLDGIGAAVWRAQPTDRRGPWHPKQCLNVWEAVWCFTRGAAIATGDQHHRGMIRPGYLADLVVLDRNIFTIEPRKIFETKVEMTVVNGEIVLRRV